MGHIVEGSVRRTVVTLLAVVVPPIAFMVGSAACISGNDAGPTNLPPPIPGADATSSITVLIAANAAGQGPAAYGENPLTVDPRTKVTWTNKDSVQHTATSDSLIWDSGPLDPGESYSFTFTTPGTYPYHDTIYGKDSMSGTIEVRTTVMPQNTGASGGSGASAPATTSTSGSSTP